MKHYKTESKYLDVIVSDFSLPMWRGDLKFDAIITDRKYIYISLYIRCEIKINYIIICTFHIHFFFLYFYNYKWR